MNIYGRERNSKAQPRTLTTSALVRSSFLALVGDIFGEDVDVLVAANGPPPVEVR